jgi:hypothetical protein
MIEAKAFGTFIRIYSLFKSEHLSANIKLTLHKALIRSAVTYACTKWELVADTYLLKLQRQKEGSPHHWKFTKVHSCPRFTQAFNIPHVYDYIKKYAGNKQKSYKTMRMDIFAA